MTLIKSISGIRGTIGGQAGEALTPIDTVKFTSAYGSMLRTKHQSKKLKVVIGRDGRISGPMMSALVSATLSGMGIDVLDLGLSTTPTVEMAVVQEGAHGGIILTASHNPKQWNALKLLNEKGEFISEETGRELLRVAEQGDLRFAPVEELGQIHEVSGSLEKHIQAILALPYVDTSAIEKAGFSVVIDAINSSGAIAVPALLKALGVNKIKILNGEMNGNFSHNPEPLPEHLTELSETVRNTRASLGISVDPDVDRLAFVCENGEMFGEEYTLVAVADYILGFRPGTSTVSNLSSTRALRDITEKHGGTYHASAVGEVNVVNVMKETRAFIGGEGNGGIIVPELHYGRDALVGIALFLTHLAKSGQTISGLRALYPDYAMSKNKIELRPGIDVDAILIKMEELYKAHTINKTDGLKIEFDKEWVHLRKSNTEPIIRIYTESPDARSAKDLADRIMTEIRKIVEK
ncbi:MAG TPA: phosphoglucosamine mutase [Bacteroidia bacterium]|nr:phosphoglucosamine mutase [Bacteroidia bacterium]